MSENLTGAEMNEQELAALMAIHPAPWMVMAQYGGRMALKDGNLQEISFNDHIGVPMMRGLAAAVNICACRAPLAGTYEVCELCHCDDNCIKTPRDVASGKTECKEPGCPIMENCK